MKLNSFVEHSELEEELAWIKPVKKYVFPTTGGYYLPISTPIYRRVFQKNPARDTVFHVFAVKDLDNLAKLQGKRKSISAYTDIDPGLLTSGINAGGGLVAELDADILIEFPKDLMSQPDANGRRWIPTTNLSEKNFDKINGHIVDLRRQLIVKHFKELDKGWLNNNKSNSHDVWRDLDQRIVKYHVQQLQTPNPQRAVGKMKATIIKEYMDGLENIMKRYALQIRVDLVQSYIKRYEANQWNELVVNNIDIKMLHIHRTQRFYLEMIEKYFKSNSRKMMGNLETDPNVTQAIHGKVMELAKKYRFQFTYHDTTTGFQTGRTTTSRAKYEPKEPMWESNGTTRVSFSQHSLEEEVAWLRSASHHIFFDDLHIPLSAKMLKRALNTKLPRVRVFHVTSPEYLDQMIKMQGKKKSISAATQLDSTVIRGGINTRGGLVFELEADVLVSAPYDIMSRPDKTGRRWLEWWMLNAKQIPGGESKKEEIEQYGLRIKRELINKYHPNASRSGPVPLNKVNAEWTDLFPGMGTRPSKHPLWKDKSKKEKNELLRNMIKDYIDTMEKMVSKYSEVFAAAFFAHAQNAVKDWSGEAWDEFVVNNYKIKEVLIHKDTIMEYYGRILRSKAAHGTKIYDHHVEEKYDELIDKLNSKRIFFEEFDQASEISREVSVRSKLDFL